MKAAPDNRLFHALDVARGIAAVVVTLYHLQEVIGVKLAPSGFLAVDFFFGLSGFVVAHSYTSRLLSGKMSMRQFMVARLVRLYPLYLLALVALVIVLCVKLALRQSVPWGPIAFTGKLPFALFMLPSPSLDFHGYLYPFNIAAWSILFELAINFVFALFCRPLQSTKVRFLIILISGGLYAAQLLLFRVDQGGPQWSTFLAGIVRVTFSFFVGVQLYDWYRQRNAGPIRPPVHSVWCAGGLLVLTACLLSPNSPGVQLLSVFILFPLLIWTLAHCDVGAGIGGAAMRKVGVASYGIYMLSSPFGFEFENLIFGHSASGWLLALQVVVSTVSLILVSVVADTWFDKPVRALLQKHVALRRFSKGSVGIGSSSNRLGSS